jgi:hypothetical protein
MPDGGPDSELSRRLFGSNSSGTAATSSETNTYDSALLEQYKLYVEMADRISARRGQANSYFLTLNTALVGLFPAVTKVQVGDKAGWLAIPLVALLGECFAWFYLVRGYRLLNSAKYDVVGALEERLPASPWGAEWWALTERAGRARYWPLSHIENWIPVLFALMYVAGYLVIVLN